MKSKKKYKIKTKWVLIFLIVIGIGLIVSSSKLIRVQVASETNPPETLLTNFVDTTATASKASLNEIKNSKTKNIILFTSSWCGSCSKLSQDLNQVAKDYPDINVYIMDLETDRDAANELGVPITPTLVLLENGETKNYPEITIDDVASVINDFNRIGIR